VTHIRWQEWESTICNSKYK